MDAVKYLKELHRMCSKQCSCNDCPIYKATGRNCGMAYNRTKKKRTKKKYSDRIINAWARGAMK